mgnify:CR=1 FL=1
MDQLFIRILNDVEKVVPNFRFTIMEAMNWTLIP